MFGGVHQSRGPCHVPRSGQSMIYRLASPIVAALDNKFSVSVTSRFCPERIETNAYWVLVVRSSLLFSLSLSLFPFLSFPLLPKHPNALNSSEDFNWQPDRFTISFSLSLREQCHLFAVFSTFFDRFFYALATV